MPNDSLQGQAFTMFVLIGMAIGTTVFIVVTLRGARILSEAMHRNFHLGYELKYAYEKVERLANTDELTGINNRRAFFERGEQLVRHCERNRLPLAAIVMDVDHFKRINDTQGHHLGNMVLQQIGKILEKEFRKSDVVGRLGGEEFAILLPDTELEQAQALAEQLRLTISQTPLSIQDLQMHVTASLGVATGTYNLETLLPKADAAMYQAKTLGRNRTETAH